MVESPIAVPGRHVILFHEGATLLAFDIASRTRDTIGHGQAIAVLETGHLVLQRGEDVLAVRFDLDRFKMVGEPEPLPLKAPAACRHRGVRTSMVIRMDDATQLGVLGRSQG